MSDPLIQKDFYKLDVYRFDLEHVLNDWYSLSVSDTISWNIFTFKAKKQELLGLADFIKSALDNNR